MIKFTDLFGAINNRDYYTFKIIWNDENGHHVLKGRWYQDHMINVIAWADEMDLEVKKFNADMIDNNCGDSMIEIELDSCGECFSDYLGGMA